MEYYKRDQYKKYILDLDARLTKSSEMGFSNTKAWKINRQLQKAIRYCHNRDVTKCTKYIDIVIKHHSDQLDRLLFGGVDACFKLCELDMKDNRIKNHTGDNEIARQLGIYMKRLHFLKEDMIKYALGLPKIDIHPEIDQLDYEEEQRELQQGHMIQHFS